MYTSCLLQCQAGVHLLFSILYSNSKSLRTIRCFIEISVVLLSASAVGVRCGKSYNEFIILFCCRCSLFMLVLPVFPRWASALQYK